MIFNRIRTLLILLGVFYYSEGKACPELTRSHQTRCEIYFKCVELPTKTHVWVPVKCEKGLVYVHNLRMCALPGDDWECTLSETRNQELSTEKPSKIFGNKETDIYIVTNADDKESNLVEQSDDGKVEIVLKSGNDDDMDAYESSGDGIDFSEGFLEATNKETTDTIKESLESISPKPLQVEATTSQHSSTKFDPSLTAHLQHLSQLIDGLKQKYQDREHEQADLSPDQLNAFLAHFNIKNEFNNLGSMPSSTTTPPRLANNSNDRETTPSFALNMTKLKPETKVILTSSPSKRYGPTGYSNSQIVVNRPGGSVLFSLTPYENNGHYDHSSPKISEDTLKTVLELSKQMIATQNIPQVIPNPTYYAQPILQPLILPPSSYAPSSSNPSTTNNNKNPFSNFYSTASNYNNNNGDYFDSNGKRPNYEQKNSAQLSNIDGYSYSRKPGTTIIHNNVHVTATGASGEKGPVDSYGQSLDLYPPLTAESNSGNTKNDYSFFQLAQKYENNQLVTTARPYAAAQFPSPYDSAPSTTIQPPPFEFHVTPETIAHYYTPNPHLNENNVNSLFLPPNRYPTYHQQVERPSAYQLPSTYPEKLESMESEDQQDSFSNYANQQQASEISAFSTNGHNNPYSMSRPAQQSSYGNKPKFPNFGDSSQLVNIGGNFISFDTFQHTILPLMGESSSNNLGNIEVISCQVGVRQPNITDCRRYYVCSKKDGKVLSYSCPPYTAFNEHARICDARTYANCAPNSLMASSYTISENKRLEQEAQRRREEAIRAQQVASLFQHYNEQMNVKPQYNVAQNSIETETSNVLNTYAQQAAAAPSNTARPPSKKKRKYYCKEGDKIPDQTSIYNYFVCYKSAEGMMKGHKMTCSKGLLFCPMTRLCTLPAKCS